MKTFVKNFFSWNFDQLKMSLRHTVKLMQEQVLLEYKSSKKGIEFWFGREEVSTKLEKFDLTKKVGNFANKLCRKKKPESKYRC